jgi:hypothetical protein
MNGEDRDYHEERTQVLLRRGFYAHVLIYAVVNAILIVVNVVASPNFLWFYWVTIFWGVGLIFHAIDVYTYRDRFFGIWEKQTAEEFREIKHRKTG